MRAMTERRRALIAGANTARLPAAYQEVEYLRTTGSQYLVINNVTLPNAGFSIKYKVVQRRNNYAWAPSLISATDDKLIFFAARTINGDDPPNVMVKLNNTSNRFYTDEWCATLGKTYKIEANINPSSQLASNGSVIGSLSCASDASMANIILFNYMVPTVNDAFIGYVSYVQLYSYYQLMYYLIPCFRKSDSKPGMYDLVNNVFYTNAGSDEFTVGPNV